MNVRLLAWAAEGRGHRQPTRRHSVAVVLGLRRGGFDTQLEPSQRQSEGLLETRGVTWKAVSSRQFSSPQTGSLRQQEVNERRQGPRTEPWTYSRSRRLGEVATDWGGPGKGACRSWEPGDQRASGRRKQLTSNQRQLTAQEAGVWQPTLDFSFQAGGGMGWGGHCWLHHLKQFQGIRGRKSLLREGWGAVCRKMGRRFALWRSSAIKRGKEGCSRGG